jgi:hypothetical protein
MTDGTYGGAVGVATPNSNTNEFEIYQAVDLLLAGTSATSNYTSNAQLSSLEVTGNTSTWVQTGINSDFSAAGLYSVIGLGSSNSNSLEVYNPTTPTVLTNSIGKTFNGTSDSPTLANGSAYYGAGSIVSLGSQLGFALNTTAGTSTTTWYGDSSLNSDLMDHMLVYNLQALAGTSVNIDVYDPTTNTYTIEKITLQDPYLLVFEDTSLANNGSASDMDYNDLMVLVDGVSPVDCTGVNCFSSNSNTVPEPNTGALLGFGLMAIAGFVLRRKLRV